MPKQYRRNSLRYPGYDYSQSGAYFITINTHMNLQWFGTVMDGLVKLSIQGVQVDEAWTALEDRFAGILLDDHVIMPNHVRGIVMLGTDPSIPTESLTLGIVVNAFKNSVLAAWRKGVQESGWPRYEHPLWHRDYHERIIRNDAELEAIREYIRGNPARWSEKHGR
jgi:REP element-mobilizing transposase RayT